MGSGKSPSQQQLSSELGHKSGPDAMALLLSITGYHNTNPICSKNALIDADKDYLLELSQSIVEKVGGLGELNRLLVSV